MAKNKLNENEYEVLEKILEMSHMCDIFEIKEVDGEDVIYDFEEDQVLPFKEGLDEICQGMADWKECYGLTDEDCNTITQLVHKHGLDYVFE